MSTTRELQHVGRGLRKPITAPLYNVILHDDNTHSYEYVIKMLCHIFNMSADKAYMHTCEVDKKGVSIVDTTSLERAELKREQIKDYGADPLILESKYGMRATIEPAV